MIPGTGLSTLANFKQLTLILDFLLINTFLNYIEKHSQGIKALSPIPYVRDSPVSGRVFDRAGRSKLMPGVDSGFFVNRQELGRCIHWFMDTKTWPLGAIPAGHEYLMLVSSKDNNRWGQK